MSEQFHFDPDTYLEMVRAEVPRYDELQERIADAATTTTSSNTVTTILDLGTGTGETATRVLQRHPRAVLIGIDESGAMLAHAASTLLGSDLRVARLQDPLPPGPFDLVISSLAVHHVDEAGKADLFQRVADVLKPGGRFVLGDVVVPDDPADAITPIEEGYDLPSTAAEQVAWLTDAGLVAAIVWQHDDLAILVADKPSID